MLPRYGPAHECNSGHSIMFLMMVKGEGDTDDDDDNDEYDDNDNDECISHNFTLYIVTVHHAGSTLASQ